MPRQVMSLAHIVTAARMASQLSWVQTEPLVLPAVVGSVGIAHGGAGCVGLSARGAMHLRACHVAPGLRATDGHHRDGMSYSGVLGWRVGASEGRVGNLVPSEVVGVPGSAAASPQLATAPVVLERVRETVSGYRRALETGCSYQAGWLAGFSHRCWGGRGGVSRAQASGIDWAGRNH